RVPEVIVHHIQRASHPLRDLLDEAEGAGVLAYADAVERRILEGDAPEFVSLKLQIEPEDGPFAVDVDDHMLRLRLELEVQRIHKWRAVHAEDPVTRLNPQLHREGKGRDCGDRSRHGRHEIDTTMRERADYRHK